ncbi:hypothetical protein AVEN_162233-1 [Araneus ventricosus]|uniref:Uncharacterized protein n=1 Tax=Araneus ventricosus TaxID=182803 RepID=A0A4Y2F148_ARAVE|nr:hypothetical protein AVEN_162233-1 [Araneus ventricosus]
MTPKPAITGHATPILVGQISASCCSERGRRKLDEWSLKGPLRERKEMKGLPFTSPSTRSERQRVNGEDEYIPQINYNEIWILTDSRSSIQHFANWHRVRDNTGMNILNKLKSLSASYRIHLQLIPSHVNIQGNEIADALAKAGSDDASVPSAPLTYLKLFSRAKRRNKNIWLIPPEHHWYQGSRPGGCLSIDCSRRHQTTLTRFLSGHIRSLTCSHNSKCFEICPKCTAEYATSDHILACPGLSQQDLVSNPLLTLDFFRVHRLMDLI